MEKTKNKQHPSLTIRRRLSASPEKIWRALTEPEGLRRWMAPGVDFAIPVAEVDLRVGGRCHLIMRSPEGEEHDLNCVYREIVPPRKLVYTWAWKSAPERESLVTIELRAAGQETELMLTHERFYDEPARDEHNRGWTICLDRLQTFVSQ